MLIGLLFALAACFIWGTVFIVPQFLENFSVLEVALGRYFAFGVVSSTIYGLTDIRKRRFGRGIWAYAAIFGLITNIIYYLAVVIALRYATAPITVLVLGLAPIAIALYGNFSNRVFEFRSLLLPCGWIFVGLFLVNVSGIDWSFGSSSFKEYMIGLISALCSLAAWVWYAVQNARFLKAHPEIKKSEWTTLLGMGTFVWIPFIALLFSFGPHKMIDLSRFTTLTPELGKFLGGIFFLGSICSWLGFYFWSKAGALLPISIAGTLIVFETIFALLFVFILELRLPHPLELMGIVSMFAGIFLALRTFRKQTVLSE